jgi:hypothetical protein
MSTVDTLASRVPRAKRYACSACKGSDLPSSTVRFVSRDFSPGPAASRSLHLRLRFSAVDDDTSAVCLELRRDTGDGDEFLEPRLETFEDVQGLWLVVPCPSQSSGEPAGARRQKAGHLAIRIVELPGTAMNVSGPYHLPIQT